MNFTEIFEKHKEWSLNQFGKKDSPLGPINHMGKEVEELKKDPQDAMEYADILILLMDAWLTIGKGPEELLDAVNEKIDINRARVWPDKPDENGVFLHKKD